MVTKNLSNLMTRYTDPESTENTKQNTEQKTKQNKTKCQQTKTQNQNTTTSRHTLKLLNIQDRILKQPEKKALTTEV